MNRLGEHLLAFLLIAGFPVWDVLHMRYVRSHRTRAVRMVLYATIVTALWLASAWAVAVTGTSFQQAASTGAPHWKVPAIVVIAATVVAALATVVPALVAYPNDRVANAFAKALRSVDFMVPRSPSERAWFAAVSVSAGVCEEILYRGYLLHYGIAVLRLPTGFAILLAVAAFGVAHSYQGGKGIAVSGLLGAVFMAIYLGSGMLWPAMLLHGLMDLRVAILPGKAMPA